MRNNILPDAATERVFAKAVLQHHFEELLLDIALEMKYYLDLLTLYAWFLMYYNSQLFHKGTCHSKLKTCHVLTLAEWKE